MNKPLFDRTMVAIVVAVAAGALTNVAAESDTSWKITSREIDRLAPEDEGGLPNLNDRSVLNDYLTYGALNNPDLRAAFNEWQAALYRIPQARALPDPRFNYGYVMQEVETRVGPQEHRLGISQMFPWFGKLKLKADMAVAAADAAHAVYDAKKLRLFYNVKSLYYEYYYVHRAIDSTRKNIELMTIFESVARARYRAGADLGDTIKAQVEQGKLDDQLRSLIDLVQPIAARFNAILGRAMDAPVAVADTIVIEPVTLTREKMHALLRANNPELTILDYQQSKEQYSVKLAEKEYYPDLMFGLDYMVTAEAMNPAIKDSGKDSAIAMVSVTVPLWRDKYRSGVREAESRTAAARELRGDRENELGAELQLVHYQYRDAERKIDLFRDTLIPKAEQSLNVVQKGYESGKVGFLTLIDAQRLLLEFELDYHRAVATRMQKLGEIEMLLGGSVGGTD